MIFNQNIKKSFGILRESAGLIGLYVVVFALRKQKRRAIAMRTNYRIEYKTKQNADMICSVTSKELNLEFR